MKQQLLRSRDGGEIALRDLERVISRMEVGLNTAGDHGPFFTCYDGIEKLEGEGYVLLRGMKRSFFPNKEHPRSDAKLPFFRRVRHCFTPVGLYVAFPHSEDDPVRGNDGQWYWGGVAKHVYDLLERRYQERKGADQSSVRG